MKKKTKDLIKILPLDNDFKKDLLEKYDGLADEQKFNIGRLVWSAYDLVFLRKLNDNMEVALEEAKNNQEKLDEGLYSRVRDLTLAEMEQVTAEDIKAMDLDIARDKLAAIISKDK